MSVKLRVEYEGINKVDEILSVESETGLKLRIEDDDGEILYVICSCQPLTTAMKVFIEGTMNVELNGHKDGIKVENGTVTIRRV